LQLHGDFYNPLEKQNLANIKKIISLGHSVGLHFDTHFWEITTDVELEKYMKIDKSVLEFHLNQDVKVFSFHNTNKFVLSCDDEQYAGMLNPYSKYFKEQIGYCADSTGFWRYEILEDRLKEANDNILQVLIHDGMWSEIMLPPRRRVYKVIDDHAIFMKKSYDQTLIKFNAKNIDWEGEV
jgi:hypothetical protein